MGRRPAVSTVVWSGRATVTSVARASEEGWGGQG